MAKVAARKKSVRNEEDTAPIVIDETSGLIFDSEDALIAHFYPNIQKLEKIYMDNRKEDDLQDSDLSRYEELLGLLVEDPDEIWEETSLFPGQNIFCYIGHFSSPEESIYYAAVVYRANDEPKFVLLHFASKDLALVDFFRKGEMVYDRVVKEVELGAVEGDALTEGDELAVGLYKSMLKVRSEKDIPESEFKKFEALREETIEEADEIWRSNDFKGNVLVSFIRDCSESEAGDELFYIVVTIEDTPSNSHALLFSFPTNDVNLVDRYRHGENLQAEEIVQEASH